MSKKVYLQPKEIVYDAALDVMELQKGKELNRNPSYGKLNFIISMYGLMWELCFSILGLDGNRCGVTLKVKETDEDGEDEGSLNCIIQREYALLDSMLLTGEPYNAAYKQ